MKAQRIRITEKGWATYSDFFGGFKFTNGLSDDPISHADAQRLGSFIRMEAVDDGAQVGEGQTQVKITNMKAEVKVPLTEKTPETIGTNTVKAVQVSSTKYTVAELEALADKGGIGALRAIADTLGVKGRGIAELIREISHKQG